MKCLVINLDRSPDRLAHMTRLFAAIGLDFRRVPAVEGISLQSIKPAHGAIAGDVISGPELGCLLSHAACWQIAAESDEPFTAIFEDDIHFSADAAPFLASWDWIPPDAAIVKIETFLKKTHVDKFKKPTLRRHSLRRLRGRHLGAAGYIVSRTAARLLLESETVRQFHVDRALFEFVCPDDVLNRAAIYQLDPAICVQDHILRGGEAATQFASTLEQARAARRVTGRVQRARLPKHRRVAGEISNIGRKWLRRLRQLASLRVERIIPFGRPLALHASASISASERVPGTMVTGIDSPAQ